MKKYLKIFFDPFILIFGLFNFLFSKKNNQSTHHSFITIYCITSGFISFLLSQVISFFEKPKLIKNSKDIDNIDKFLNKNGYSVLSEKYHKDNLENLIELQNKIKCYARSDEKKEKFFFKDHIVQFPTYSYSEKDLLSEECVLKTITDPVFLEIAKKYLNTNPVLTSVNMWWSTNYLKKADSEAAQMFHFDLDRIKWLKFFIYLTDVNINSGPHVYVSGTHKPFSKPYKFMLRGYKRILDEEINNSYEQSRIKTICGDKGTIIIGDTSCYHKGLPPLNENRLIFEFELSNSLFGGVDYEKNFILEKNEIFDKYKKNYPSIFKAYK